MINTYASKKNHHITKERLAVQEQTVKKTRIPSQSRRDFIQIQARNAFKKNSIFGLYTCIIKYSASEIKVFGKSHVNHRS